MRGEFVGAREEIIREVFEPLQNFIAAEEFEVDDLWADFLREAIPEPQPPVEPIYSTFNDEGEIFLPGDRQAYQAHLRALEDHQRRLEAYNDAATNGALAWVFIESFFEHTTTTEKQLVKAIEDAFGPFQDHGGDALSNEYFRLVERFVEKFSLRYDLRRPTYERGFTLHPTLPGLFSRLLRHLKANINQDPALADLMLDFEEAVRDLKEERTSRRIKQCIAAQFNLFEAILTQHPDVIAYNEEVARHNATGQGRRRRPVNTFGAMCDKAQVWPHDELMTSAKSLYKFASDYPGIRHGGTPAHQKREIDMRDMISMTIVLAGFSPYFSASIDPDSIYYD
ncbi:hypothetical protein [Roseibium sp.]|uniref:hypothetical protein n=1 Tax=Roseibium sp. TaxID=1936156 RepID=UPI0039EF5FF8